MEQPTTRVCYLGYAPIKVVCFWVTHPRSSVGTTYEHEQRSEDRNGGHDYQGDPEQAVSALRG